MCQYWSQPSKETSHALLYSHSQRNHKIIISSLCNSSLEQTIIHHQLKLVHALPLCKGWGPVTYIFLICYDLWFYTDLWSQSAQICDATRFMIKTRRFMINCVQWYKSAKVESEKFLLVFTMILYMMNIIFNMYIDKHFLKYFWKRE